MRHVALFIPTRIHLGEPTFFLQLRDRAAPIYPNRIGLFGGHLEPGETPDQAVVREAAEELSVCGAPFALAGHHHVCRHEEPGSIRDIYLVRVDDAFAQGVQVHEGDGGVWLTADEIASEPRVVDLIRALLPLLARAEA